MVTNQQNTVFSQIKLPSSLRKDVKQFGNGLNKSHRHSLQDTNSSVIKKTQGPTLQYNHEEHMKLADIIISTTSSNLLQSPKSTNRLGFSNQNFKSKKSEASRSSFPSKSSLSNVKDMITQEIKQNAVKQLSSKSIKVTSPTKYLASQPKLGNPQKGAIKSSYAFDAELKKSIGPEAIAYYITEKVAKEIDLAKQTDEVKLDMDYMKKESKAKLNSLVDSGHNTKKKENDMEEQDQNLESNEGFSRLAYMLTHDSYFIKCINTALGHLESQNSNIFEADEKNETDTVNLSHLLECLAKAVTLNIKAYSSQLETKQVATGALLIIYYSFIKYKEQLDDETKSNLLNNILDYLNSYTEYDESVLFILLEIVLAFEDYTEVLASNFDFFNWILVEFNDPVLKRAAFNIIINLGPKGIDEILNYIFADNEQEYPEDIRTEEKQAFRKLIMNFLLETDYIRQLLLQKALVNEIQSGDGNRRHKALEILVELGVKITDSGVINILLGFIRENKLNKLMLCEAIAKGGRKFDLIDYLLMNEVDAETKVSIVSAVCSSSTNSRRKVEFAIDDTLTSFFMFNKQKNIVFVNEQDFVACLRRLKKVEVDISNVASSYDFELRKKIGLIKQIDNLRYSELLYNDQSTQSLDNQTSGREIELLVKLSSDYSEKVRETVCSALSNPDYHNSAVALKIAEKLINDNCYDIQSKAAYSLSFFSSITNWSTVVLILSTFQLFGHVYKVRTACLSSLAVIGACLEKQTVDYLFEMLKQKQSMNKQIIAETILKIGSYGESVLLKLLSDQNFSNIEVKYIVTSVLKLFNLKSFNIDFVCELMFQQIGSASKELRLASYGSIISLYLRSKNEVDHTKENNDMNVTRTSANSVQVTYQSNNKEIRVTSEYLKTSNVMKYIFKGFKDTDSDIRGFCIEAFPLFGRTAEQHLLKYVKEKMDSFNIIVSACSQTGKKAGVIELFAVFTCLGNYGFRHIDSLIKIIIKSYLIAIGFNSDLIIIDELRRTIKEKICGILQNYSRNVNTIYKSLTKIEIKESFLMSINEVITSLKELDTAEIKRGLLYTEIEIISKACDHMTKLIESLSP